MYDDILREIERLYYETKAGTVQRDLARAIELLKQLPDDETRQRAAVYMDGLMQMRSEWQDKDRPGVPSAVARGPGGTRRRGRP
jgi:hypothetical protein